jgi:hypothetical protein
MLVEQQCMFQRSALGLPALLDHIDRAPLEVYTKDKQWRARVCVFLCSTVHRCLEIDNSKTNNMHTWINMCFLKCTLRWISLFFSESWNTIKYSGFDEICENVMNAKAETVLASSLSLFCHVKQICSSVKIVCYWLQWGELGGHIFYYMCIFIYIYILQQYMRWGVDPIGSIEKMRKFKAARLRE